jgi:hypothetical protein
LLEKHNFLFFLLLKLNLKLPEFEFDLGSIILNHFWLFETNSLLTEYFHLFSFVNLSRLISCSSLVFLNIFLTSCKLSKYLKIFLFSAILSLFHFLFTIRGFIAFLAEFYAVILIWLSLLRLSLSIFFLFEKRLYFKCMLFIHLSTIGRCYSIRILWFASSMHFFVGFSNHFDFLWY